MAKFLFIYRGNPELHKTMTPENMQQNMQQWQTWLGEGMKQGWLVNPGDGLKFSGRVVTSKVVTDGPFVESKEIIGGFSVVQADSYETACGYAKGCPNLAHGAHVEIRQLEEFKI